MAQNYEIGEARIEALLSHSDKVLWPQVGITKRDLVEFYLQVFPRIAPFVSHRPLVLQRCPKGVDRTCFFQKQMPAGMPDDTPSVSIKHENREVRYVVGGTLETEIALANLDCVAIHLWNARKDAPRQPDWVCFDLDPETGRFADAARAAILVREALVELGLRAYAKTSGKRGVHVFVPIWRGPDVDTVREFAKCVGEKLAQAHPDTLTVAPHKADRKDCVYLDPFRNGFGQTVASPYGPRRAARASVSTPLAWTEVVPELDPLDFRIDNFADRLAQPDPWESFFDNPQDLRPAMKVLGIKEQV